MGSTVSVVETPTPESLVAQNVADLREERKRTVRSLSAEMDHLGRKILPSGITKIENGGRGVDVGDLVALAIALRVTPNRLLLPGRTDGDPIALAPTTTVDPGNAWLWAEGRFPLITKEREKEPYDQEERADFVRHSNPQDRWHREQHTAIRAARDVLSRLDDLLRLQESGAASRPRGSNRREMWEEAPDRVRSALDRLVAEINDLLGSDDAR